MCPFGALCRGADNTTNGLRAQAGYYGVRTSDTTVVFHACATGYCCDQVADGCVYDYCAGSRRGRLCGQCEAGMGLVFFSEGCKANSECDDARWSGSPFPFFGKWVFSGCIALTV